MTHSVKGAALPRRTVLKQALAGAGLASAAGLGWWQPAEAAGSFDWKKYQGTSIEVSLTKNTRGDLLQKYQKEFEELTGIKVGAEQVPEQQHRQKVAIEFTSGAPSFDVVTASWHVQKRLYGKGKWFEDLRPFLADATLTAPDYDFADFAKGAVDYATQPDGRMDTLPLNLDYWIIYWNKELFQAKGLAFPKNFDELISAAQTLNDPKKGISGWVSRGMKNANVPVWTSFLLGHGVDPIDAAGKLQTDTPEAIAAAEIYKRLNREFAPPGVVGFNWNECQTSFVQGKAAMWLDGIGFALPLEDPTRSRIVGKVGYGVMPAGPKAQHSALFGDGIGIAATSKNKQAAWLYCQWATSKVMQSRNLLGGYGSPGRQSAFTTALTSPDLKAPKEWVEAMSGSIKIARPGLPEIFAVTEFRDTFGVALTNLIGGADPATELKKATEAFKPVLEKTEKA
ncbi:MAG TPA: sugar ABC transporter substrate-binding protein [Stellaceae bacterium]|nr:sugar ABC transporter substrate-binding protein [Stellaceae bacterium]